MPISSGLPIWTGAPCTAGKRVVIWMARIASAGFIGRIETTMGPWNRPAGPGRNHGAKTTTAPSPEQSASAAADARLLEGGRAAQHEGDVIAAPMGADIGRLVDELAVPERPVARQVGADVEVVGERRQPKVAGRRGRQQRAGFGVELAEPQE